MSLSFEVLCVTMHQKDFSKIEEMNLNCNVFFSNQSNSTNFEEVNDNQHTVRMLTTNTRGVGINRNFCLLYANADICLLADDDMHYVDNLEDLVINEFNNNPSADVIVFNVDTDAKTSRQQKKYKKTRKVKRFERMPWGSVRIAFRLDAIKKSGVMFSTLFGGGSVFACGEDSIFLKKLKKAGLSLYVSKETIGFISFDESSWYTGRDEKLFYAKGAYIECINKKMFCFLALYYALRMGKNSRISFIDRLKWIKRGRFGFNKMISYSDYRESMISKSCEDI